MKRKKGKGRRSKASRKKQEQLNNTGKAKLAKQLEKLQTLEAQEAADQQLLFRNRPYLPRQQILIDSIKSQEEESLDILKNRYEVDEGEEDLKM